MIRSTGGKQMILIYAYIFIATVWKYIAVDKDCKTVGRAENKRWLSMMRLKCVILIVFAKFPEKLSFCLLVNKENAI